MSLKEFSIRGYRSIRNIQLQLNQINVIVGANGSGKSNLYKALYLLSRAVDGALSETLAFEGGIPSILWAGKQINFSRQSPVNLSLSVNINDFYYEIICGLPKPSLSKFNLDPEIKEEYLWIGKIRRPSTTLLERKGTNAWVTNHEGTRIPYLLCLSNTESVLSQLKDPNLYPELFALTQKIKKWRFYHLFKTDLESPIRYPQIGTRTEVLSNNGHNLAAAIQTIIEIGDESLLYKSIDNAFPGSKIFINVDSKTRFDLQLQMPGLHRPLEANELSDGTLRYLCLIAALLSPRPAELIVLNEPEVSLNSQLIKSLAELIVSASAFSQIWITTHSNELAECIYELSGDHPIHLLNGDQGTQIAGSKNWELYT